MFCESNQYASNTYSSKLDKDITLMPPNAVPNIHAHEIPTPQRRQKAIKRFLRLVWVDPEFKSAKSTRMFANRGTYINGDNVKAGVFGLLDARGQKLSCLFSCIGAEVGLSIGVCGGEATESCRQD